MKIFLPGYFFLGVSLICLGVCGSVYIAYVWSRYMRPHESIEAKATAETIAAAAADPHGSYVIHAPPSGCPAGWTFAPKLFTARDGTMRDACVRAGASYEFHIDVLMPGEQLSIPMEINLEARND